MVDFGTLFISQKLHPLSPPEQSTTPCHSERPEGSEESSRFLGSLLLSRNDTHSVTMSDHPPLSHSERPEGAEESHQLLFLLSFWATRGSRRISSTIVFIVILNGAETFGFLKISKWHKDFSVRYRSLEMTGLSFWASETRRRISSSSSLRPTGALSPRKHCHSEPAEES